MRPGKTLEAMVSEKATVVDVFGTPFTVRSHSILPLRFVESPRVKAVLPLCVGSAIGAYTGGHLAGHAPPEEPLQLIFGMVIFGMGAHKYWALRGKV